MLSPFNLIKYHLPYPRLFSPCKDVVNVVTTGIRIRALALQSMALFFRHGFIVSVVDEECKGSPKIMEATIQINPCLLIQCKGRWKLCKANRRQRVGSKWFESTSKSPEKFYPRTFDRWSRMFKDIFLKMSFTWSVGISTQWTSTLSIHMPRIESTVLHGREKPRR